MEFKCSLKMSKSVDGGIDDRREFQIFMADGKCYMYITMIKFVLLE